ncbi:MAG: amylo-alpha-1,6-glucosidase [Pleurocapsa sp.]
MNLQFGREICNNLQIALSREWLVTNGIGGYAAGTIAGVLTRRYHGLLLAALQPPVARTLLLSKLDEIVDYNGILYDLATNCWADGAIAPQGYLNIESFHLEGTIPVWNFAFADGLLEKRVWMKQGENTTYIRYSYKRGSNPLTLSLKALVNYRDHHGDTQGKSLFSINKLRENRLEIQAFRDTRNFYLTANSENKTNNFIWEINNIWYRNFALAIEKYRGLNYLEDCLLAATGKVTLQQGDTVTIIVSTEAEKEIQKERENVLKEKLLITNFSFSNNNYSKTIPQWIEQLILAANQFIVDRPSQDNPKGKTIIAGYPWFSDWGRDTAIALPGLTISTGRYEIAKIILRTFAKYVDRGMLPNVFPDAGETPHYNTVDATLWYFEAIRAYYDATKDREFIAELFPLLVDIIDCHVQGTRHNIHVDDDGLLYAGESGVQLTWMDAKVDDWVVTPRIGKPVEVNALWYNSLVCMGYFSGILGESVAKYQQMAATTRSHFAKFWYDAGGYCYDVIDSPDGNDASFRPNQIFAVSLPSIKMGADLAPLDKSQQKMIVDKVAQKLLTSSGLRTASRFSERSLSTDNPHYIGIYGGDRLQRDGSYHQGTTWGWLIGHFVQAHLRVYNNPELARSFLLPMSHHLGDACIGSISEIFDGDAPFIPRGCFAQAWSVAEVLRAWLLTETENGKVERRS